MSCSSGFEVEFDPDGFFDFFLRAAEVIGQISD
jgi:hypothetical protein